MKTKKFKGFQHLKLFEPVLCELMSTKADKWFQFASSNKIWWEMSINLQRIGGYLKNQSKIPPTWASNGQLGIDLKAILYHPEWLILNYIFTVSGSQCLPYYLMDKIHTKHHGLCRFGIDCSKNPYKLDELVKFF